MVLEAALCVGMRTRADEHDNWGREIVGTKNRHSSQLGERLTEILKETMVDGSMVLLVSFICSRTRPQKSRTQQRACCLERDCSI